VSETDGAAPVNPARADADRLAEAQGETVQRVLEAYGEVTVDVDPQAVPAVLAALEAAGYDFLLDLAATDYLDYAAEGVGGYWGGPSNTLVKRDISAFGVGGLGVVPKAPSEKRFAISYQLLARTLDPPRRLRVRTFVDDGEPVASAVEVFPCTDYQEREAYDLMGIEFAGHPNLTRIFLPEDWDGHPHRKDYPVGGEPVQFSDDI
jgi:NADH:ubiquinone oxidoreductase subunit C